MTEQSTRPLVVVLGASGFIGSSVSRALATRPVRLRLVSRRFPPVPTDACADIEVHTADLTTPGELATVLSGADVVLHLVAHTESGWRVAEGDAVAERVNLGLVEDLVEVCRSRRDGTRPPAVVFAGSGLTGDDRIDLPPTRPRTAYCRQKLTAEWLLEQATVEGVLRGVSLRLPPVFGQGIWVDDNVVEVMVRRALAGEALTMWHDGTMRRDLVHIEDVTAAFLDAIDHIDVLAGSYWPIGTGTGAPMGKVFAQISQIVADHTGEPAVSVVSVPVPAGAYPSDLADVEVDASRFRAVTGWRPRISLRDGLVRTVAGVAGTARPRREGVR